MNLVPLAYRPPASTFIETPTDCAITWQVWCCTSLQLLWFMILLKLIGHLSPLFLLSSLSPVILTFFFVLSFHLPVQLSILFSFLPSKLLLLGYLPSCTLLSCDITFSVLLLCHLQVPKASLIFLPIRLWHLIFPFFASTVCFLVTICILHLLPRVLSPSSFTP